MNEETVQNNEVIDTILPTKKSRIWEVDFLRGLFIMLMLMDHMFVYVAFIYGPKWFMMSPRPDGLLRFFDASVFYIDHPVQIAIHLIVVCLFIFICGLSSYFSKSNLKRGAQLLIVAMLISFATYIVKDIDVTITFGILHNLALSIIVWSLITLITKNDKKKNLICGLLISLIIMSLFFATILDDNFKNSLGKFFFILINNNETAPKSPGDFFPIIPWSSMFFLGASLAPYLYPNKTTLLKCLDGKWNKPLCFIGRHTLIIYLLHTFVICGILELITFCTYHTWIFLA